MAKRKQYKALLIDIDDTCVVSGFENLPSEGVKRAIKQLIKRGIPVCIATGRVLSEAMPVLDALAIQDPCILSNGSMLYDPVKKKPIETIVLEKESILKALEIVKPHISLLKAYTLYENLTFTPDLLDQPLLSFNLVPVKPKEAEEYVKQLQQIPDVIAHWTAKTWFGPGTAYVTFGHKNATKQQALLKLFKLLEIDPKDIVAVGDGDNDLQMIIAAGMGVAMGNSVEGLKAVADYIAPTVQEDGLVHVIDKFFPEG